MNRIQSRQEFKHRVLLTLGHPAIRVDLSDEHLDVAVDKALRYFFKFSHFGSFESHYTYQVTKEDVEQGYVPVPNTIDAVVEVIPKGMSISDLSFATAEYQMSRETFMAAQRFNNVSLVDFVTLKQRLYHTQQMIAQPKSFEFVRYQRRLIPFFTIRENEYIVFRCYENIDPEENEDNIRISSVDLWDDETLLELAVAESKVIWGNILKKFGQVVLPGGVTLDGQKMYEEGKADFEYTSKRLMNESPISFSMG